ncbi:MAG: glycosyltransferase family 39 protein [Robiginitalea sp.]|uniref:ArnT family glycosyltransferase n=1 Tax=Robiginitalea sp. TaxID=1902411 RepID=UPI003C7267A0
MNKLLPKPLLLLLGGLFVINLLQSYATELIYDEAYYWYYSQNLSWGYFDHPPMVGWMIALGYGLFQNELGVRLVSCFMGTGTALLIWSLVRHPDKKMFYREFFVWILSITLLHAYGFLSLPDTPLLFFTALFLWVYRRFVNQPGPWISLALGICMSALMYSKYHAALVILFVLFSNLQLLKNRYAWLALGVSLLCYLPHLYWLFDHDFVSLEFHLFERPNQPYNFSKFTLGFLLNLLALFGLTFPFVYKTLFAFRAGNKLEKAMVFLIYGFLIFFFISSFQRRVQTQWLVVISIPAAVIVAQCLVGQPTLRKWIWRLGLANVIVLAGLRLGLVYEPLFPVHFESHGNKVWVSNLKTLSKGVPVVFENSYRKASMYAFYSQEPAISLNNAYYRKDQYAIDGSEALVQGKQVFYVYKEGTGQEAFYLDAWGEKKFGTFIENFSSYRDLKAGISEGETLAAGQEYSFWIYNPYQKNVPLKALRLGIAYLDASKRLNEVRPIDSQTGPNKVLVPGDTLRVRITLPKAVKADPMYLRAVISENDLPFGLNGKAQRIKP